MRDQWVYNSILIMPLSNEQKIYLLNLARQTIADYFNKGEKTALDPQEIVEELSKPAATFVTLTIDGDLRGCVGNLIAKKPLYQDIINNSLLAAFGDNRFPQLTQKELEIIKVEISILSEPTPYKFDSPDSLLEQIMPKKHGLIIQNSYDQATYLPQVWDDLPDKIDFLESLCQKAGLPKESWKDESTKIFYYTVGHFSEN